MGNRKSGVADLLQGGGKALESAYGGAFPHHRNQPVPQMPGRQRPGHVDKYFAFSVLTDSSGLFQQIQVLGDSEDHSTYISALRDNLKKVLEENAGTFNRVVIHTSFKLKHEEIRAIQQTTHDVATATDRAKCRFSVIKVNHKSRFFGINRSINSLVPFEATEAG